MNEEYIQRINKKEQELGKKYHYDLFSGLYLIYAVCSSILFSGRNPYFTVFIVIPPGIVFFLLFQIFLTNKACKLVERESLDYLSKLGEKQE